MDEEIIERENGEAPENEEEKPKKASVSAELLDWYCILSGSVLMIVLIFALLTRHSTVDGDSMLPTLHDGDHLLITGLEYTPEYNDIVVVWTDGLYNNRTDDYGKTIVKRIIGLEGDAIRIDFDKGVVYRNDEPLPHEMMPDGILYEDGHAINNPTTERLDMYGTVRVPEGYVFVMGDNRNNSTDSRDDRVGMVSINNILGKAYLRVAPFESFGGLV